MPVVPRALVLDSKASTLVIHTRAKGMLARLAHDLEIAATHVEGNASLDGETFTGELTIESSSLEVTGVLRAGRDASLRPSVDRGVLSASARAELARRMREDGLRGASTVHVAASGTKARADLVDTASGRDARTSTPLDVGEERRASPRPRAGPALAPRPRRARDQRALGAFVVSDEIEVWLDAAFIG